MKKQFKLPQHGEAIDPEFVKRLGEIERAAIRYDWQFRLPYTRIRFGIDPLAGLLPVVGDLVMAYKSVQLVLAARSLGIDAKTARRMWGNILVDVMLGVIPLAGPVIDVFFRCNLRNVHILLEAIEMSRKPKGP